MALLRTFANSDDDSVDDCDPAGVYYIALKSNGVDWGVPELLYESHYLRGVGTEANIRLAAAERTRLSYISPGITGRASSTLMKSVDGGGTWDQPMLVAGPSPDSDQRAHSIYALDAKNESALLIWQSGQPGSTCVQYYQFSENSGNTWRTPTDDGSTDRLCLR
jgi:hypothetical protein